MIVLLKVFSCDKSISDYYEEIYEDILIQLVNENNVIDFRSFFQNINYFNIRKKKFKDFIILKNDMEKIEFQFEEIVEMFKVQSVLVSDMLMFLGQSYFILYGLFLLDG